MDRQRRHKGYSIFSVVCSGLVCTLLTIAASFYIATHYEKSSFNITIDGKEVKVTPVEYQELMDENKQLKEELDNLLEDVSAYKQQMDASNNYEKTADIIEKVQSYINQGRWEEAVILIKNAPVQNDDIKMLYENYSLEYSVSVISNVESLISAHQFNEAKELLQKAAGIVADNDILVRKIQEIENMKPAKLTDLAASKSRHCSTETEYSHSDTTGNIYVPGNLLVMEYYRGEYGYIKCPLNGKYTSLSGIVAVDSESNDAIGYLEILTADDEGNYTLVHKSSDLGRDRFPHSFENVQLGNAEWLELRYIVDDYWGGKILLDGFTLYP